MDARKDMTPWIKALVLWLAILVLAVINGAAREKLFIPALGNTAGLITSGMILASCIFLVAWLGVPWYGRLAGMQWLQIGAFWLVLTLLFEFGFGRLVQHQTWAELLEAYRFKGGNIWPLVLVVTLISPWCAAKIRAVL